MGVRVCPASFIWPFEVSPQQYSPVLVAAQVWAAPMVNAVISPLPVSTAVGVAGVLLAGGLPGIVFSPAIHAGCCGGAGSGSPGGDDANRFMFKLIYFIAGYFRREGS